MKAEISQPGLHRAHRFSGVYQQQGRMLVDRDWNELTDILRHLGTAVASQAIGTGVPRRDGLLLKPESGHALTLSNDGGLVTAVGVIGEVRPRAASAGKEIYGNQLDLPEQVRGAGAIQPLLNTNTSLDNKLLYVDIWERTVAPVEFADLVDPALPRDEGCIRTQRVAQIKAATAKDVGGDADHPAFLIPAKGNAQFTAVLTPPDRAREPCDPCAEQAAVTRPVPNGLFRLEVHSVGFGDGRQPNRLMLKWSRDNGARELRPGDAADPARRAYEYFSDATERLLGMPSDDWQAEEALRGVLDPEKPTQVSGVLPRIREWDGWCEIKLEGGVWSVKGRHAGGDLGAAAGVDNGKLTVRLDDLGLTFMLTLDGRSFLAGDYWLALLRARAPKIDRVRAITALPLGIEHRYCILGTATVDNNGAVSLAPWSARDARRLQHPSLTALDAADVAYAPGAPALKGHDTVKKAIDAIAQFHPPPAVGVTAVTIGGAPFSPQAMMDVHPAWLDGGISIAFVQALPEVTSPDFPVCTVSIMLPWPLGDADRARWGTTIEPGFETVALAGKVTKEGGNTIVWKPHPVQQALPAYFGELHGHEKPLRVRACVRIGGRFVRSTAGNQVPDVELWFWLAAKLPPIRRWTETRVVGATWISVGADGAMCWITSDGRIGLDVEETEPQFLSGLLVKAQQVSVADRSTIWAVGAAQGNKGYRYRGAGADWEEIQEIPNTGLKQVSVAADGTVWGIDGANVPWRLQEFGRPWEQVGATKFVQVATGSRLEAWAIDESKVLWQFYGGTWQVVFGAPQATNVSIAADGTVWCVGAGDGAASRYLGPARGWEPVPAPPPPPPNLKRVAVGGRSYVWGLGEDSVGTVYRWGWVWPRRVAWADFQTADGRSSRYGRIAFPFPGNLSFRLAPPLSADAISKVRLTFTTPLDVPFGNQSYLDTVYGGKPRRMGGPLRQTVDPDAMAVTLSISIEPGSYELAIDPAITDEDYRIRFRVTI